MTHIQAGQMNVVERTKKDSFICESFLFWFNLTDVRSDGKS